MKTKVIFRKFEEGDIIALFPELVGTNDISTCMSYQHVGQHGAASVDLVYDTKPATPSEYKDLYDELTNMVGYDLQIVKKFTYKAQKIRKE